MNFLMSCIININVKHEQVVLMIQCYRRFVLLHARKGNIQPCWN